MLTNGNGPRGQLSQGVLPRGDVVPFTSATALGRAPGAADDARLPLRRYAGILRDNWALIAAAVVLFVGAVAVGVGLTQPTYRATATVEIRKQSAEVVPVAALFQFERISEQYLQTEYGTLRSRALLQRTLADRSLGLRLQHYAGLMPADTMAELDAAAIARLAERVQKWLHVDPVTGSRIIRVSFEAPDATLSADVVNALLGQYAAMRREAGAAALTRLAEQADSVRTQLVAAEQELQQFVRDSDLSVVVIGGATGGTVPGERLRRLQQELTDAETDGYRAAALSTVARDPQAAALESDLLKNLRARIAEVAGEYARSRPTYTDSFPRMQQLRAELLQLDSLVRREEQRVSSALRSQHEATVRRRQLLQTAVDEQRGLIDAYAATLAEYERRQRDVESLKQLYHALQQKSKEAALTAALAGMDIAAVDTATAPTVPVRPRPGRDVPLAAVVGLLFGLAIAFLRDYSDTTVKRPEQLIGLRNAPLLGMIPAVRAPLLGAPRAVGGSRRWHRIDAGSMDNPLLADAFRGLRTSVLFDAGGALPHNIMVTSSMPGDGKTTVSANFAISVGTLGYRVLLVDTDMRRPSLHRFFGLARRPGFREYLEGRLAWSQALCRGVGTNVDLLAAGHDGASSDLLSTEVVHMWLEEARASYDFVICDAPALAINVPDARILSQAVQGVLLVIRSGATSLDVVHRLVTRTPNLIGIVLNQLSPRAVPGYYSDYGTPRDLDERADPNCHSHRNAARQWAGAFSTPGGKRITNGGEE